MIITFEQYLENSMTFSKKRANQPHKSFYTGRVVSLPTHKQKLGSLDF